MTRHAALSQGTYLHLWPEPSLPHQRQALQGVVACFANVWTPCLHLPAVIHVPFYVTHTFPWVVQAICRHVPHASMCCQSSLVVNHLCSFKEIRDPKTGCSGLVITMNCFYTLIQLQVFKGCSVKFAAAAGLADKMHTIDMHL